MEIFIVRYFGFCYGVENVIEIVYWVIVENFGKCIFLFSQMIYNLGVNEDFISYGICFLQDIEGNQLIDWLELILVDIVIILVFGILFEIEVRLKVVGVNIEVYNIICFFVEKVWNWLYKFGEEQYIIVIYGKYWYEEIWVIFLYSVVVVLFVIVKDFDEVKKLVVYVCGEKLVVFFYEEFVGKFFVGFDFVKDFNKIGVVN